MGTIVRKSGYMELDDLDDFKNKDVEYLEDDAVGIKIDGGWRLFLYDKDYRRWYSLDEYFFKDYDELVSFFKDTFITQSAEYGYKREDVEDDKPSLAGLNEIIEDIVKYEISQGRQPASWVADEDIWEKAKEIADKSDPDNYWAFVTYMYKKLGGRIKGK